MSTPAEAAVSGAYTVGVHMCPYEGHRRPYGLIRFHTPSFDNSIVVRVKRAHMRIQSVLPRKIAITIFTFVLRIAMYPSCVR